MPNVAPKTPVPSNIKAIAKIKRPAEETIPPSERCKKRPLPCKYAFLKVVIALMGNMIAKPINGYIVEKLKNDLNSEIDNKRIIKTIPIIQNAIFCNSARVASLSC